MKNASTVLLALAALPALSAHAAAPASRPAALDHIETVAVIYGENRSFDKLYGLFPGANGVLQARPENGSVQRDRDASVLAAMPPVWQKGNKADPLYRLAMPNAPFRLDAPPVKLALHTATRDLTHRFYQNQLQINGGKNDLFVAYTNAGALPMGYYDGAELPLLRLAQAMHAQFDAEGRLRTKPGSTASRWAT